MKLSQLLIKQAEQVRAQSTELVAISLLEKSGMTLTLAREEVAQKLMEKEATSYLTSNGIDYDDALRMVKVANVKLKGMSNYKPELSFEEMLSDKLIKAASEAKVLEDRVEQAEGLIEKVAELEAQLDEIPEVVKPMSEPMAKFASSGAFTNEDLQALTQLPSETLTKIAASQDAPWRMGKSSSEIDIDTLDPLARFCLG